MKYKFKLFCLMVIAITISFAILYTFKEIENNQIFIYRLIDRNKEIESNFIERSSMDAMENVLIYKKFQKEDITVKWLNEHCECYDWYCKNEESETCDIWRKSDKPICTEWKCWRNYYARLIE